MGLSYQDFRDNLFRALDVRQPAPERGEAQAQFADLLRNYPLRDYPTDATQLLEELSDAAMVVDPVLAEAACGWTIPVVREFALGGALDIARVAGAFKRLMSNPRGLPSSTWRQLALALEAIATNRNLAQPSLELLREVPSAERRAALRDDTLRLLEVVTA